MLKLRRVTELVGLKVYTDAGEFVGEIEEVNIVGNKVESCKIKVAKSSRLAMQLGGAKGIIIPYKLVKSISDVVIISKSIAPVSEEETIEQEFQ